MRHKEFITSIANKIDQSEKEVDLMLAHMVDIIRNQLAKGNSVQFQGFGTFDFRRREERISVHPATQVRTLIPPKQVAHFRPSATLRNKLKEIVSHE